MGDAFGMCRQRALVLEHRGRGHRIALPLKCSDPGCMERWQSVCYRTWDRLKAWFDDWDEQTEHWQFWTFSVRNEWELATAWENLAKAWENLRHTPFFKSKVEAWCGVCEITKPSGFHPHMHIVVRLKSWTSWGKMQALWPGQFDAEVLTDPPLGYLAPYLSARGAKKANKVWGGLDPQDLPLDAEETLFLKGKRYLRSGGRWWGGEPEVKCNKPSAWLKVGLGDVYPSGKVVGPDLDLLYEPTASEEVETTSR